MIIKILPNGDVIMLDEKGSEEFAAALGTSSRTRASHVHRDDKLALPFSLTGKPVLAMRTSDDGQWVVRLSMSPLNGRHAGYQLPERFASRREAIQAEVEYIEREVLTSCEH